MRLPSGVLSADVVGYVFMLFLMCHLFFWINACCKYSCIMSLARTQLLTFPLFTHWLITYPFVSHTGACDENQSELWQESETRHSYAWSVQGNNLLFVVGGQHSSVAVCSPQVVAATDIILSLLSVLLYSSSSSSLSSWIPITHHYHHHTITPLHPQAQIGSTQMMPDQVVQLPDWELYIMRLAREILAEQSPSKLLQV